MKKITLSIFALLMASTMIGQTFSTGTVTLFPNYTAKIDVDNNVVTVTLVGPATSWLGLGFNATGMDSGDDVIIFDGTNTSDRTFGGIGVVPSLDVEQNWWVTSNTVNAGVRTVVTGRERNDGDATDFQFSASAQPLTLSYARSIGTTAIGYHGGGNCGTTTVNLALANESFSAAAFKMFPNPAQGFTSIELPSSVESGEVKIYDNLGRVVRVQNITTTENKVSTADLSQGTYLVVIRTDYGNATKSLIVE